MTNTNLDVAFNPGSIAVAGVSSDPLRGATLFLYALLSMGYSGKLYPINPKGGEMAGLTVHPNLLSVLDPIDYVICGLPAHLVPQLIKDCIIKKVKAITLFTSGFSETGSEDGQKLEIEITRMAKEGGLRIIGPNCMGIYCPESKMSFALDFPKESGPVSFLCQSGGIAMQTVRMANMRGATYSKVISYGNAADVNETELIDYFGQDLKTRIIACYIEGVKDGNHFNEVLTRTAREKPVIILKGGNTEAGAKAAASHTGSLAGSDRVWEGMLKQSGAIRVRTMIELSDMIITTQYMKVPKGRKVGIVGVSGGGAVLATDDFVNTGFTVPALPEEIREKLQSFLRTGSGTSLRNPVDVGGQVFSPAFHPVLSALANYDGLDFIIVQLSLGVLPILPTIDGSLTTNPLDFITDSILKVYQETGKPIAVVITAMTSGETWNVAQQIQQKCYQAGLASYTSMPTAASAINLFINYHEHKAMAAAGVL